MVFSLIILVLVGAIAYFHYLQGFFSATISALLAVIGAVLAVGYHEVVAGLIDGGRFPEYSAAVALVAIFAVSYIVMRLLFDKAVPGNVQLPLLVDRIGGAAMGVVAGICAAGVFAIAMQTLPFGPTIAGFTRYPVEYGKTVSLKIEGGFGLVEATYDLLDSEAFLRNDDAETAGLWIPADTLVLQLASLVSRDGGSLDCGRPFDSVHPDYLQELFGQRVGIQSGSKHVAVANSVEVGGIFLINSLPQDDPERWTNDGESIGIRGSKSGAKPLPREYRPGPGRIAVVLRTRLDSVNEDDATHLVAFTPASVRLVANKGNYFPIGTVEGGRVLYRNAADDPLFVPGGRSVDLVFELPEADLLASVKDKATSPKIAENVFLEFKRFARVDLAFKPITLELAPPGDQVEVVRKQGSPEGGAAASGLNATLIIQGTPVVSDTLFTKININIEGNSGKGEMDWGTFTLAESQFSKLEVDPVRTIQVMETGRNRVDQLVVPDGHAMVQINARPAGDDRWKWADAIHDYTLVDGGGNRYAPKGVVAKINNNGQEMMLVRYDADKGVKSVPPQRTMRPTDVILLFTVPNRSELKSLDYKGQILQPMQFRVQRR